LVAAALMVAGCGGVQADDSAAPAAAEAALGQDDPCADPEIRDRVDAATASTTDEAAASTLATPEEMKAAGHSAEEVAAQQAAWDALSEEDRDFQRCLAVVSADGPTETTIDLALLDHEQAEEDRLPDPHDPDDFGIDPATTRLLAATDSGNRYWVGLQPAAPAVPGREKDSVCLIAYVAAQPGVGAGCQPVDTFGSRGVELGHDGVSALLVPDTHDEPAEGWHPTAPNLYLKEPGPTQIHERTIEPLTAEEAALYKALVHGTGFAPVRIDRNSIGRSWFIDACFEDGGAGTLLCFTLHLGEQAARQIEAWEDDVLPGEVPGGPDYEPIKVRGGTGMMQASEWAVDMRVRSDDGSHVAYVNVQESNPNGSVPAQSVDFVRDVFIPQLLEVQP
jgi:hypothetical protein